MLNVASILMISPQLRQKIQTISVNLYFSIIFIYYFHIVTYKIHNY